jgi:hypothetical protein
VDELLGAAGMTGFLGVLDPPEPVPHLLRLVHSTSWCGPEQAVDRALQRRQEALVWFAEAAWRVNAASRKLNWRAQALLRLARRHTAPERLTGPKQADRR